MPYPNFHSARIREPEEFERIVVLETLPNGIMIYGGPLKSDPKGPTKPQAYRFPKDKFTVEEAKSWLKEHNIKYILFEPAKDTKESMETSETVNLQASKGGKRIIFTNEVPNDQGSIIPNDVYDFSRYKYNPVLLKKHDWHSDSIGDMTDIQFDGQNWSGIPKFHKITEESKRAAEMYEGGWLRSASVGGESIWKTTGEYETYIDENGQQRKRPVYWKDENGLMRSEYFMVYEISLPTLPSNPMAVTEDAIREAEKLNLSVIYTPEEIANVHNNIVTLKSKLEIQNSSTMAEKKEKPKPAAEETATAAEKSQETEQTATQSTENIDKSNHVILENKKSSIPGWLKDIIGMTAKFAHPEGEYGDDPIVKKPEKKGDVSDQPTPTGMAAKKEAEAEKSRKNAEDAVKKVKEAKEKYEGAEGEEKEKFKKEYDEACKEAEEACREAEEAEEAAKKAAKKEAEEAEEESGASKKEAEGESETSKKEASKNSVKMNAKPVKKTREELSSLGLQPIPQPKIHFGESVTFSKLSAKDNKEGQQILNRVFNGTKEGKTIDDYRIILNSILEDPKYSAIAEKTRFHLNPNEGAMESLRSGLRLTSKPNPNIGVNFKEIAARLNTGVVEGVNFKLGANPERRTMLTTDGNFSTMDTVAVEWLPFIIYKLFPSESWKNEIPIFGVQDTARNLGIIWTNIAADPTIGRGTAPANTVDYTYDDTAVGLKLTPYYTPTIRWTPIHMHQLRYDQQASGWAQTLAKLEAIMGDDMLYTLAAGVIANSQPIVKTRGPVDSTQTQTFIVGTGSNGIDKFYFNSSFAGTLTKPGFNDIMAIEQIYDYLNFNLEKERPVLVVDSIMKSYIKQDKQTQSMLTRWINDNGSEVQKISNTLFHPRSRVVAYDPAGGTAIDTNASGAVIPVTTQSAALSFVSSQVGIGLGLIDVFFIQDPANYGFKMSMDLRIGIRALRSDYTGVSLYVYDSIAQSGQ